MNSSSTFPALHHIGILTAGISTAAERFIHTLGATWDGRIIYDPQQRAYVAILARADGPMFELVEPDGPSSPLAASLARGGSLHHLCYEVEALDQALSQARALGGLIVRPATPAIAFNGRRIAWVYSRDRLLVEYLERTYS